MDPAPYLRVARLLLIVAIIGLLPFVFSALLISRGSDHASHRANPLVAIIAGAIIPRNGGRIGRWYVDELDDRVRAAREELVAGLWRDFRNEYLDWESDRNDSAQRACFEFPYQRTLFFKIAGRDTSLMSSLDFPNVRRFLHRHPYIVQAAYYTLEPKSRIFKHRGVYPGILRYHIGLEVSQSGSNVFFGLCEEQGYHRPDDHEGDRERCCEPAVWTVDAHSSSANQVLNGTCTDGAKWSTFEWTDGGDFVFDDNNLHFAVNDGPTRRLIFTFDFPRPNLPLHMRVFNEIILRGVLRFIPSVAKYADAFNDHLSDLLKRPITNSGRVQCVMERLGDVDEWREALGPKMDGRYAKSMHPEIDTTDKEIDDRAHRRVLDGGPLEDL